MAGDGLPPGCLAAPGAAAGTGLLGGEPALGEVLQATPRPGDVRRDGLVLAGDLRGELAGGEAVGARLPQEGQRVEARVDAGRTTGVVVDDR